MNKFIIDIDTDFNDLNSLSLCVSLHFKKIIKIIAIICTDGFIDALTGTKITQFWLEKELHVYDIPVITGITRSGYNKTERYFPERITNNFLSAIENNFGNFNNYESKMLYTLDNIVCKLIKKHTKFTYIVTGPLTTLSYLLQTYCIKSLIKKVFFMGGSLFVEGNIINQLNLYPKSEYNVYLDSDAFRNVQNILTTK
jgi:inosine-uridine nucleoside N-ribohydrolase